MNDINELANALKPVVLPGEFMKVFILKEGKEYNQGVAYLDDGTMVVVDNARRMISKNIDVVVTSVLQTTAGKMIFGRYIESAPGSSVSATQSRTSVTTAPPVAAARGCPGAQLEVSWPAESASRRSGSGPDTATTVLPPFHWWRTVFFLIPLVALYTIVLGTVSLVSTLFDRTGDTGHWCARTWSRLILKTTGVRVSVRGLEQLDPGAVMCSPGTIRAFTTSRSCSRRFRCSSGSSRRRRSGRFPSSAGTSAAPDTCSWTGRIPVPRSCRRCGAW